MDTLELIRAFREVAARGSFSQASRALEVSKPTVSKYVAELEQRLGLRLFHRTTRSVTLTDAGNLLLERSTPLMDLVALTTAELLQHASQPSGRLRITAPHGLGQAVLPELLAPFLRAYPEVSLQLHLSNRMVDMVEEGIDLALRVGRIQDMNLIVRKLRRLDMQVCASPAYWAEHGIPTHPDQLAAHAALTYTFAPRPIWRFENDGVAHSVEVRGRFEASDPAPLVSMARQGMGVAYLPGLLVQADLDQGRLQAVLTEYTGTDVWLYVAYAQRRHNSAALKALLAYLEQHLRTP